MGGDPGGDAVIGDPTEPGGGAAYLVLLPGDDGRLNAGEGTGLQSVTTSANQPTSTTTQPTTTATQPTTTTTTGSALASQSAESPAAAAGATTTTVPTPAGSVSPTTIAPPTATLPKPVGATASGGTLARTGGTEGPARPAGLGALVLGTAGLALRRRLGRLARASEGP